jgi:serine/threonine protein kinase
MEATVNYSVVDRASADQLHGDCHHGQRTLRNERHIQFLIKDLVEYESVQLRDWAYHQEVAILVLLRHHRGIPRFIGFDISSSFMYRVLSTTHVEHMPPVQLESLLGHLEFNRKGTFDLTCDIARGLQALHREGVVHLDLSSYSVHLYGNSTAHLRGVIANFGACRILSEAPCLRNEDQTYVLNRNNDHRWNVYYRAPETFHTPMHTLTAEQARRANMYGLGMLMHAFITGKPARVANYVSTFRGEKQSLRQEPFLTNEIYNL